MTIRKKKILYLDMDGVLADFDKGIARLSSKIDTKDDKFERDVDNIVHNNPTFFQDLEPIEGAIEAVNELFKYYDVYFLTTAMWEVPHSMVGKRIWLEKYFGENAKKKLVLTHRKDLVIGDILVDDRTKNGACDFKGEFIQFNKARSFGQVWDWEYTLKHLLSIY